METQGGLCATLSKKKVVDKTRHKEGEEEERKSKSWVGIRRGKRKRDEGKT